MESYLKDLDTPELQKAKLVIGQFITSCSHTMRGPLKSITGLTNLLQNHKDYTAQEIDMFLSLIESTTQKMERTLDELEHFLENSKRDVTYKLIDCRELLDSVLHQYRDEISSKNELTINLDQTVPFYSDAARLRIILSNLISNAIQFRDTNKTSQEIKVSLTTTKENCELIISDNGIGIDPDNQPNIFQLFYRATERSSGTGVGLYVVKEAIEKMNGSISVDSVPGQGSTFKIILPNHVP